MLKFYTERNYRGNCVDLHIAREDGNAIACATSITFAPLAEGEMAPPAALRLRDREAQMLIDALWDAGLRPSEGSGSAGAMLATQKHLADMRKLVAKHLDVAFKDC